MSTIGEWGSQRDQLDLDRYITGNYGEDQFDMADESEDEEEVEDFSDVEEEAAVEQGEVCSDCGERFTEANGMEVLCQDCHEAAEDRGETGIPPLSKFPLVP
jgi:formylmethanofuran dehydrogenase subunit E